MKQRVYSAQLGNIDLTDKEYLASGGEGDIFLRKGVIFKIYKDAAKKGSSALQDKIQLLANLPKHPAIVAPLEPLFSNTHEFVGFTMPEVSAEPLMRQIATPWQESQGLTRKVLLDLAGNMRDTVDFVHANRALIVDGNELNWLVRKETPYLIDVDSWQIGSHPATAIQPSIIDYQEGKPSVNADWFAWAIVTFQLFAGIHPYKGTHPDFKRNDLAGRMKANASVFDAKVRLPPTVRDWSDLPSNLLQWYEATFAGNRSLPPSQWGAGAKRSSYKQQTLGNAKVQKTKLYTLASACVRIQSGFALSEDDAFDIYAKKPLRIKWPAPLAQCAIFRAGAETYVATLQKGHLEIYTTTGVLAIKFPCVAERLMVWNDRLFLAEGMSPLGFKEVDTSRLPSFVQVKATYSLVGRTVTEYTGMGVAQMLGTPVFLIPQTEGLLSIPAPTFKDKFLVDAIYLDPQQFIVLWSNKAGNLVQQRVTLRYGALEFGEEQTVDTASMSWCRLSSGLVLNATEEGDLRVYAKDKEVTVPKVFQEVPQLVAAPYGVAYLAGQEIYRLQMG